jgi:hypothetical protein
VEGFQVTEGRRGPPPPPKTVGLLFSSRFIRISVLRSE